jgi:SAM-dependent methyltransferase
VRQGSLLDVRGSFDAVVAVVSLHHIEPLQESCNHLATLLPPGTRLVIRGPYLHRWELRASLREVEVDLIAEGLLPAVGARLIATRSAG